MRRTWGVLFLSMAMSADASAESAKTVAARHDTSQPIHVSSNQFLADVNSKSGTWSGNVVITQGDIRMHANSVRMNIVNDKPEQIFATGDVVVDSPNSGTATGDNGVYEVGPRQITLNGHVVLSKDKNVMRGSTLRVDLVTGKVLLGAKDMPGGRVQGLFTPPPQSGGATQKP